MRPQRNLLVRVLLLVALLGGSALTHAAECSAIFTDPSGINDNLPNDRRLDYDKNSWPADSPWPASGTQLASGDYYFEKDKLGDDYILTVAPGATVRIFVDGNMKFEDDAALNASGTPDQLLLLVDGKIDVKDDAIVRGLVYAEKDLKVEDDALIEGVTGSESKIKLKKGGTVSPNNSAVNASLLSGLCDISAAGPDHIRLTHPGSGLTCSPADITVTACANEDCSTLFSDHVTVDFTSPTENWSPDPVTFKETTNVLLQHTAPEAVTLDAEASSPSANNPTRCFSGSGGLKTCEMTFLDSGFIIDVPDHIAAVTVGGTIAAVSKDPTSQRCVPGFSNVTRDVALWSTYSDPDSGTESVVVDTQPIAKASPGTVNTFEFDADGIAAFDLTYPDAGWVGLSARYDGSADNGDTGLVLTGEADFIARPERFLLDVTGNPEATDANGGVFRAAGETFEITVSALNANGDVTPNFGKESAPESVRIESSLVAPSGGEEPPVAGDFGAFGQACDGTSTFDDTACGEFNWPEVGIIALTPRLAGASGYLGFEDVVGTRLDNVGRFIPARFELTIAEPGIVEPFCAVSAVNFAYMGQSLSWQNGFEPIITVDVLNTAGVVTQNYTSGDFLKLDALDLARAPGANDKSAVDAQGNPFSVTTTLAGMTFSNLGAGRVQYIFSDTDNLIFDKTIDSRVAPFTPDYSVELSGLEDSDGVTALPQTPVEVSPSFGFQVRYGRLNVDNAYGPEIADLIVPFRAVYYTGSEFSLNEPDSCWAYATGTDVALDDSGLSGGSTSVIAKSDTLVLGEPAVGSELILSAPGETNTGNVGVTFAVPNWLQGDYDDDGTLDSPSALATFGVYRGHDRVIYWQER